MTNTPLTPDQEALANGLPEPEHTPEQLRALDVLDTLDARLALGFTHFAESLSKILNQYSEQAQIVIELARAEFGVPMSDVAAQYKELMDAQTQALAAQEKAVADLVNDANSNTET